MPEDDAGGAEREAGGVEGRHEAAGALAHVDDDDPPRDGVADDAREGPVGAAGGVARAEGLEHEAAQVRHAQHAVDHGGRDAREDAQGRDVRGVEAGRGDGEGADGRRPQDARPVDVHAEARDAGQGGAVGGREGLEGARGYLGAAVAAVQRVVEKEADLRHGEGAGYDEGAEEVVHGVGLQGEDGGLRAGEHHGLAEVGEHEG